MKNKNELFDGTIITGSCNKYFKNLKKMLNSACNYKIKRIVVYDLGIDDKNLKELEEINNPNENNIIIEKFYFDKYPEHLDLKKYNGENCSYAWKPIIIDEVCNKYKGIVFWFDSSIKFHSDELNKENIYDLFNIIALDTPIYSPQSKGTIKKWTHPNCLEYFYVKKYLDKRPRSGGIIGINYDNKAGKLLVERWKKFALIKDCIIPEGSNRNNHRQDQSILSILYYQIQEEYKFKIFKRFCGFTPHIFMCQLDNTNDK